MRMDRRAFLRTSALGLAAVATPGFLAACSRGPRDPADAATLGELLSRLEDAGAQRGLSVFLAGEDYVEGVESYLGFGLVRDQAGPIGDEAATLWLAPTADPEAPVALLGPLAAAWQGYVKPDGPLPSPQGINAATIDFDAAGIWTLVAQVDGPQGALVGTAAVQVKPRDQASTRLPGEEAIASLTPTTTDNRGVDPICTRTPPCDFHQVTLREALGASKPTAFYIGTPRFCTSRTCGPNLEELIAVADQVGDRATFVHAEVYRDDEPDTVAQRIVAPTFTEWGLQSEPWLFLIDADGVVASRFEGPVTASVITQALQPLLA